MDGISGSIQLAGTAAGIQGIGGRMIASRETALLRQRGIITSVEEYQAYRVQQAAIRQRVMGNIAKSEAIREVRAAKFAQHMQNEARAIQQSAVRAYIAENPSYIAQVRYAEYGRLRAMNLNAREAHAVMKAGYSSKTLTLEQLNDALIGFEDIKAVSEFTSVNGRRFFGVNGNTHHSHMLPSSGVRQLLFEMDASGIKAPWHGWCAEASAVYSAEQAGAPLSRGSIRTLYHRPGSPRHSTFYKPCKKSCVHMLEKLGIKW